MVQVQHNESQVIDILSQSDVIRARQAGRALARNMGFGTAQQTRLATAISELVRNVLVHANHGFCYLDDMSDEIWFKILIRIEDSGPGIEDLDLAMTDGFSTKHSLGAGLPGARRIVQSFTIESSSDGTKIAIEIHRPRG